MSEFVKHEPCPSCGSKDNLGTWSDGHSWCFGCGFYIPGYKTLSTEDLRLSFNKQERNKGRYTKGPRLPTDFVRTIPNEPLGWLRKYGITDAEIVHNHIGWSHERFYLVYPLFDTFGNLLLWQGRYFGTSINHPRFYTEGFPDKVLYTVPHLGMHLADGGCVVCVEDMVSAIKVGRVEYTYPLLSSQLNIERIRLLSDRFSRLVLWLDRDKAQSSIKLAFKAGPYFDEVQNVISDRDPKEYSTDEIRRFLGRGSESGGQESRTVDDVLE